MIKRHVRCLIWLGDKLLLVRKNYGKGHWSLPGGGVEKGETPELAAKRETLEETDITVNEVKEIGNYLIDFEGNKIKVICFSAVALTADFKVDGQEISEANWFEKNSFPRPISETVNQVLAFWTI